jgi:hypothetical protein
MPLLTPNPPRPFHQDLWENERPLPKAIGEPIGRVNPLLTPNPVQPFYQTDWSPVRSTLKAKIDDVVNLLPFRVVVVVSPPFQQNIWDSVARALPKAGGEAVGGNAPLLTPNPPQPFSQSDWFGAVSARKAIVDDAVDFLPRQIIVVVPPPFAQSDWPPVAVLRAKVADASLASLSPLYFPNPVQPFSQEDWPAPRGYTSSDRGFGFGLDLSLPLPFLPIVVPPLPNFRPPDNWPQMSATAYSFVPLGRAQLVVSGVVGLSQAVNSLITLTPIPNDAVMALIAVRGANIRWTDDGQTPTTSFGMLMHAGQEFAYSGNLSAIRFISVVGTATLDIGYYK